MVMVKEVYGEDGNGTVLEKGVAGRSCWGKGYA
jgi:hypothetical protein